MGLSTLCEGGYLPSQSMQLDHTVRVTPRQPSIFPSTPRATINQGKLCFLVVAVWVMATATISDDLPDIDHHARHSPLACSACRHSETRQSHGHGPADPHNLTAWSVDIKAARPLDVSPHHASLLALHLVQPNPSVIDSMATIPQNQNLCDVSCMRLPSFRYPGFKLSPVVLSPEAEIRVRAFATRPASDG